MAISVFDLFKVGIGPSSSHTVGPMRAARTFAEALEASPAGAGAAAVKVELFGSLGATRRGHGTDKAVILGLLGETPEGVDVEGITARVASVRDAGALTLLGRRPVAFREKEHLSFLRQSLPTSTRRPRAEASPSPCWSHPRTSPSTCRSADADYRSREPRRSRDTPSERARSER